MRKIIFLLLSSVLITSSAYAGGSIFGHHKTKNANPYGVYSIGVHICSDLECPPIRIVTGKCEGAHMTKHWGVCVCDEGYVAKDGLCEQCPEGQYSDGVHECTDCAPGTYKVHPDDTSCTPCPQGSYCINGQKYDCPEHATACDNEGKATACEDGYDPEGGECVEVPTCSSTAGDPCTDNSTVCPGYYCSIAGGSTATGKWCGTDTYTPGAGTVQALGEPQSKTSTDNTRTFLASSSTVASWDAAVNYCDALKTTITGGVTVNNINYGSYTLTKGLADVPTSCEMGNESCSVLPDDTRYWLNGLVQMDCNWEDYDTTYGSSSCYAFRANSGSLNKLYRNITYYYALCE